MKIIKEYTVKMPSYALSYIINSDSSGIDETDIAIIDRWYDRLQKQADKFRCLVTISPGDELEYFTSIPEFGSPCNVTDCTITFLY